MSVSAMRQSRWLVVAAPFLLSIMFAQAQDENAAEGEDWVRLYEPHPDGEMLYRLMRPYEFDPGKRYPVIVSLHGGGGRGTDNRKQLRVWTRHLAQPEIRAKWPSYVLAPQTTELWDAADLERIKDLVASLDAVDTDRIYLLGHSMGGHGSFVLLQIDPAYFAAALPSAGTGRSQDDEFIDAAVIKDVPIWALHGDKDTVCPYEKAQELFAEMTRLGGNMKLTTWSGDGHGVGAKMIPGGENGTTRCSSDRCDPEPDPMEWLFSQSASARQ